LDAFVVMPNHLHGIVIINEQACEDAVGGVGAQHAVPLQSSRAAPGGAFRRPAPGSLPVVIRSFKSAVTRRIRRDARASRLCIWQRGYYEHVIRSNADLDEIRRYIAENPAKWETDAENPDGA